MDRRFLTAFLVATAHVARAQSPPNPDSVWRGTATLVELSRNSLPDAPKPPVVSTDGTKAFSAVRSGMPDIVGKAADRCLKILQAKSSDKPNTMITSYNAGSTVITYYVIPLTNNKAAVFELKSGPNQPDICEMSD